MSSIQGKTKGWKSSEFLVTICAMCIAVAGVLFEESQVVAALAGLCGIVAPAAYSASRAMVKKALMQSESVSELAKKKSSKD